MVQDPSKPISLEAFLTLPETKPAQEYIDGQVFQKVMPQGKHSTIQRDLTQSLDISLKGQQVGRAFPELRCTFGGRSLVPDISVFINANISRDENGYISNQFLLPPDWVIEILSSDQSQTKVTPKILYCLGKSTQMGWLIDPDTQTVFIYNPGLPLQAFDDVCTDDADITENKRSTFIEHTSCSECFN